MRWRRWGLGHWRGSWGGMREAEYMGLARRGARQPADAGHRLLAGGAEGWWPRRGQDAGQRFPIQQGQHPLPLGSGRGAQEAEVADALEAARQDVLKEAVEEALGREAHGAGRPGYRDRQR